jgi:hypothetical protein
VVPHPAVRAAGPGPAIRGRAWPTREEIDLGRPVEVREILDDLRMLARIGEEKTLCLSSAFSAFSLGKGGTQLET